MLFSDTGLFNFTCLFWGVNLVILVYYHVSKYGEICSLLFYSQIHNEHDNTWFIWNELKNIDASAKDINQWGEPVIEVCDDVVLCVEAFVAVHYGRQVLQAQSLQVVGRLRRVAHYQLREQVRA